MLMHGITSASAIKRWDKSRSPDSTLIVPGTFISGKSILPSFQSGMVNPWKLFVKPSFFQNLHICVLLVDLTYSRMFICGYCLFLIVRNLCTTNPMVQKQTPSYQRYHHNLYQDPGIAREVAADARKISEKILLSPTKKEVSLLRIDTSIGCQELVLFACFPDLNFKRRNPLVTGL